MTGRPAVPIGTCADDRGYIRIKVGDHPLATRGWIREHVLVVWELLGPGPHPCTICGRKVDWHDGLEVDHANRIRRDNRAENLRVVCRLCNNRNRVIPSRVPRRRTP
jgi:HNH endonuclease